MSGGKAGSVIFLPLALAGGAALLVVGGVAAGVGLAVTAYQNARENVRRAREQATNEQKAELNRVLDEWQSRLAASSSKEPDLPTSTKTKQEISAAMVAGQTLSSDQDDATYLESLRRSQVQTEAPVSATTTDKGELQEILRNLHEEVLRRIDIPLPEGTSDKIKLLQKEQNISSAAALARGIRLDIQQELNRIEKEKKEARAILDGLPPDFPAEARAVLAEAVDGNIRFDEALRDLIEDARKKMEIVRKQTAAIILGETLKKMGYETGDIAESLFVEGGTVYFRKSGWDDGYCVKLGVKGEKVNFFVQKDCETGNEQDEAIEKNWHTEFFDQVQGELEKNGIRLNVTEISPPGKAAVPKVRNIPIKTRKPAQPGKPEQTRLKGDSTVETTGKAKRRINQ